jgi:hypothetical protein
LGKLEEKKYILVHNIFEVKYVEMRQHQKVNPRGLHYKNIYSNEISLSVCQMSVFEHGISFSDYRGSVGHGAYLQSGHLG